MSADARPRRPSLGRGLSALFGDDAATTAPAISTASGVRTLPIADIHPSRLQPRRSFAPEALAELAASIAARGVLQPILVRPAPDGQGYELVAGERRWRAAQAAQLHEIPAIVRALPDRDALELALIENVQRADLNALEEAEGYRRLTAEFGYTQEDVAATVGKSRSHIANLIRLLDLPEAVKTMLAQGEIEAGHARPLLGTPDPVALARQIAAKGLSVREAERLAGAVKEARSGPRGRAKPVAAADPNIAALERELAEITGVKAAIQHGPKGEAGTLSFHYQSLDQLDGLLARLRRT